jgi:hypothetical protein
LDYPFYRITFVSAKAMKPERKTKAMTIREQARKLTTEVNQKLKVYRQNSAAGQRFTFEYKRWLVALIKERDRLWSLAEN